MKKFFNFIIVMGFLILIGFGIYYNETNGKYYELSVDLLLIETVYYINEDAKTVENSEEFENIGIKKEIYFKYTNEDKPYNYVGNYQIYHDDNLLPNYYIKVKPFSRLGLRLLF